MNNFVAKINSYVRLNHIEVRRFVNRMCPIFVLVRGNKMVAIYLPLAIMSVRAIRSLFIKDAFHTQDPRSPFSGTSNSMSNLLRRSSRDRNVNFWEVLPLRAKVCVRKIMVRSDTPVDRFVVDPSLHVSQIRAYRRRATNKYQGK